MRGRRSSWQTVLAAVSSYKAVLSVLVLLLGVGGKPAHPEEASAKEIADSMSSSSGEDIETVALNTVTLKPMCSNVRARGLCDPGGRLARVETAFLAKTRGLRPVRINIDEGQYFLAHER